MDKNPFKTKFSRDIFFNKYAHSKDDTWYDLAVRSVDDICGTRGGTKEALLSEDIRKDLVNDIFTMKFIPGGRYLYYAGRPLQAVNNCFLLKAESDDREEWGDLIKRSSDCLMLGGGIGIDYSKLRCRDSILRRTGGKASGPIPLMYSVNEYGRNVMQGGSRRSAIWAGLHWKHGDSKEFLGCKNWHNMPIGKAKKGNGQPYTIADAKQDDFNFHAPLDMTNISLIYDDEFIDEVNIGDLTGEFPATYIENCRQAMSTGEPGFSFNFGSKSKETLRNACNEVTSEDDSDVCNLGSVNLGNIDSIRELSDICRRASMFLVCGTLRADLPYRKVHLVREKNRRLGLGLMGIHEWLLKRSMPYGVGGELSSWLKCYQENSEVSAKGLCDKMSISRPVAYRAIAPTGSIGILAATTTGIEPLFAVAFKRRYLTDGTKWKYQYVVDATADRIIQETGVDPDSVETAASLASDFERRIKFQYDIQKYVDMSISSTINLPKWGSELNNEDKVGDFAKTLAKYAHGLRGFTCYPDGARGGQPLTPVKYKDAKRHDGVVFDEVDICEWSGKGGTCGI